MDKHRAVEFRSDRYGRVLYKARELCNVRMRDIGAVVEEVQQ
jgi:hypothetical protein